MVADEDKPLVKKACSGCGIEFTPKRVWQKYHSWDCGQRIRLERFYAKRALGRK